MSSKRKQVGEAPPLQEEDCLPIEISDAPFSSPSRMETGAEQEPPARVEEESERTDEQLMSDVKFQDAARKLSEKIKGLQLDPKKSLGASSSSSSATQKSTEEEDAKRAYKKKVEEWLEKDVYYNDRERLKEETLKLYPSFAVTGEALEGYTSQEDLGHKVTTKVLFKLEGTMRDFARVEKTGRAVEISIGTLIRNQLLNQQALYPKELKMRRARRFKGKSEKPAFGADDLMFDKVMLTEVRISGVVENGFRTSIGVKLNCMEEAHKAARLTGALPEMRYEDVIPHDTYKKDQSRVILSNRFIAKEGLIKSLGIMPPEAILNGVERLPDVGGDSFPPRCVLPERTAAYFFSKRSTDKEVIFFGPAEKEEDLQFCSVYCKDLVAEIKASYDYLNKRPITDITQLSIEIRPSHAPGGRWAEYEEGGKGPIVYPREELTDEQKRLVFENACNSKSVFAVELEIEFWVYEERVLSDEKVYCGNPEKIYRDLAALGPQRMAPEPRDAEEEKPRKRKIVEELLAHDYLMNGEFSV